MISKDDPAHAEQRGLVQGLFTRRAVRVSGGRDPCPRRRRARRARRDDGPVEVVTALAARVPSLLTCRLLGWPDDRWPDVRSWSERLMRIDTLTRVPGQLADAVAAMGEMAALMDESLAAKRAAPADDLMSIWAHAALGGCPMTRTTIHFELGLVVPGGAETTRTTLARALVLFAERPDLWTWLVEHRTAIPTAVEELLRWITPLNNMFRTAAVDTDIAGVGGRRRRSHRARLPVGEPRRGGVRPARRRRARPRPRTRTSRSASAPTCASAPTSPGRRSASPSRS